MNAKVPAITTDGCELLTVAPLVTDVPNGIELVDADGGKAKKFNFVGSIEDKGIVNFEKVWEITNPDGSVTNLTQCPTFITEMGLTHPAINEDLSQGGETSLTPSLFDRHNAPVEIDGNKVIFLEEGLVDIHLQYLGHIWWKTYPKDEIQGWGLRIRFEDDTDLRSVEDKLRFVNKNHDQIGAPTKWGIRGTITAKGVHVTPGMDMTLAFGHYQTEFEEPVLSNVENTNTSRVTITFNKNFGIY